MAFVKICVFFFLMMLFLRASKADVFTVGDAAGWNNRGTDYNLWASIHKFQVGDIIAFKYNPQTHNVLQVSKEDYEACSPTYPIAIYASGDDELGMDSPGNYYYICGLPDMCQDGQKIKISVSSSKNSTPRNPPFTYPTPAAGGDSSFRRSASSTTTFSFYNYLGLLSFALSILSLYL